MVMREIEARGKRKDYGGYWVYGFYYKTKGQHIILGDDVSGSTSQREYFIDPETGGYYTGIDDVNGRMVFENDIVEIYNATTNPAFVITAKIYFERGAFWFTGSGHTDCNWHFYDSKNIKVIGNIFDNPELIKGDR